MFFQLPWVYVILPFVIFTSLISVIVLFCYRKHPKWNYQRPILICWILMMVGEIGKQIYYYGTPARLPVNFCGVLLIVAPVYLLCCKCKWKRCIDISATCTYIDAFCIFATFVIYPKLLVNSLPASGIFWTNYQDFWGVIYHSLVCFIALWILFHHPIKFKWINLLYLQSFGFLLVLVMGLSCWFDSDLNFGNIARDVLPLSTGLHILVIGSIYWIGGGVGFILWKYLIEKNLPDLLTLNSKKHPSKGKVRT